ncbi:hypothetical protein LTR39_006488, partial [Cryomyces antarcticus]
MLMRGHHSGGSTSPPSGPQDALDRRDYDRHDGYSSGEGSSEVDVTPRGHGGRVRRRRVPGVVESEDDHGPPFNN